MEENNNVENTPVVEQKPKKKGTIIIIVLLVLIALGVGGYFCYDKFIAPKSESKQSEKQSAEKTESKKEETNGEKDPGTEENKEFTENDAANERMNEKLIENESLNNSLGSNKKILEDATKLLADYKNSMMYTYLTKSIKFSDLTNQQKLWMMYFYNKVNVDFEKTDAKKMVASIQETYGKSFSIKLEDMGDDIGGITNSTDVVYTYNVKTNRFDYNGNGGSIGMYFIDAIKPTKFEEKNGKYYISYKLVLSNGEMAIIIDAYHNDITGLGNTDVWDEAINQAKKKIDTLPEVTFVFENENGNLVLTEFIK